MHGYGLCTNSYTFCSTKTLAINQKSVLVCKCAGNTSANVQVYCAMLDLPQPISKNAYTEHVRAISEEAIFRAQSSTATARADVREHYGAASDVYFYILVSM